MSRIQIALNVSDIDAAVEFYSKLLGAEPAKRRDGYTNFVMLSLDEHTIPLDHDRCVRQSLAASAYCQDCVSAWLDRA